MKKIISDIKNKLNNFDMNNENDLFFLISNFKYLENKILKYNSEELSNSYKTINKILENAFAEKTLKQARIFELLQGILVIEHYINDIEKTTTTNTSNSDTFTNIALGLGLGALGFAVGKAFVDANKSSKPLENEDVLTVAYYLSKYNHDYLFDHHISAAKAIENIATVLKMKPHTLRGKRDYFDNFLGSDKNSARKGFQSAKITKPYKDIIDKYKIMNEEKVKNDVLKILNKYSKS